MTLGKVNAIIKSGHEPLTVNNQPVGFTLLDFWRWSVSDLLSNATRGRLAEFIVASAVGIDNTAVRDEWSAYDLETADGIKIEVKSAAYIQSWHQTTLSKIQFSIKPAYAWDSGTNLLSKEKKRHADVYVFCLLHHTDKVTVDPLNMDHWEFYVLATKELNGYTRSQHSITLKSVKQLTSAVDYNTLKGEITQKHLLNGNESNEQ
jgi:hypothetical protein